MIGLATRGKFGVVNSCIIGIATTGYFNPVKVICPEVGPGEILYTTINKPTIDRVIYRDREKLIPRITVFYKDKKDKEISIGVKLNEN